jgi:phenylpropionate dioxygenase-like ring-hydroxylating dioxygenase large terminal subunit
VTVNSSAVVQADIAAAPRVRRAMPAWTYNHPQMTRLEQERILLPSWQIVCHINSIPNAGDFITLDVGPESVVAVRGRDGEIRAFHNVCRHRGARILEGCGNRPGTITCPYHGWSYRLDGSLLGVPVRESFPGLDRADYGLNSVRTEVQFGFVFVCLGGEPPPLTQIWGRFAQDFAPYRFEEMVPLAPLYYEQWDVDWKVAMDNYLESYHVPIGHPGLFRFLSPDYEDQATIPGVARGISWMRDAPSSKWTERMYQKLVGTVATDLPERKRRCWSFYSMLPNLGIDIFPDQMDFFQVLPRGPGKCTIRGGTFALPDSRREMRIVRYLNARINRLVQREDEFLCARVQRGLASSSYQPGPLSKLEGCMFEFHEMIRQRIPEARLPSAPATFA